MKRILLTMVCAAALPFSPAVRASAPATAAAPDQTAAAPSPADQAYAAAIGMIYSSHPAQGNLRTENPRAWYTSMNERMLKFMEAARAFAAKYPDDPRRYNLLVQSSFTRPWFLTGFKPGFDAQPTEANLIIDQPALDHFLATQARYLSEVIVAPDATERQRGGAMYALLTEARSSAKEHNQPLDLAPITALVDRVLAAFPDQRALPVVEQYDAALQQQSPDAAKAFEARLQAMPGLAKALADAQAKQAAAAAAKARKLPALASLKFTAADGREVDLAQLRGKVVLIDFWATWCAPCEAEIPNVVANYRKYHDKGFDVIGVTLENSGVTPNDDAATAARKLAAAKKKMLAFTAAHGMPWPQYYDGKFWQNDLAKRFDVEAIPAMFLLDQNGNVVSTEARGPKLEAELKRLLKL